MGAKGPSVQRRPIEEWERPYLEDFGALLRSYRNGAGITLAQMRLLTGVSLHTWFFFEHAQRRPRHSTLYRAARVFAEATPLLGSADSIVDELVEALGPIRAPESMHMEMIERRRDHYVGKLAKNPDTVLRPPPSQEAQLQRQLRLAKQELHTLRLQRREVEAKEEELRLKEATLDRLDRQIQARELALSQRQHGRAGTG